ncbi:MAG: DUF6440 family protein [Lachnospiraceae bacterium]|nr:xylan 1,4-beta-xylosidase [Lachnospiraceae bacterium]MCR5768884.1 DUF6440 family protein [Lachnospiraceae bacterium]
MGKEKRFKVILNEGNGLTNQNVKIVMDRETGMQYLFVQEGYAGGLTPLLDAEGKPARAGWDVMNELD